MRDSLRTVRLEGAARLLAWYEEDSWTGDTPGAFFFQLVTTRAGARVNLTPPLLLQSHVYDELEGWGRLEEPADPPVEVAAGPLIIRAEGEAFTVTLGRTTVGGRLVELRQGLKGTYMS